MNSLFIRISSFYLLVTAAIGLLLRWAFISEVSWLHYRFWVHGHSHAGILGWVFISLVVLINLFFISKDDISRNSMKYCLYGIALTVLGMVVAFPLQGYGPFSIVFSTLHGLISYYCLFLIYKSIKSNGIPETYLKIAIGFYVLSTFSLWAIPVIMFLGMQGEAIYYWAIQFYLHFQFNGWIIFGCLSLFFKWAELNDINLNMKYERAFRYLLSISCFGTYSLAIAWSNPEKIIFYINSLSVLIQFGALIAFFVMIYDSRKSLYDKSEYWFRILLGIALMSFILKIGIQTVIVIPEFAQISFTIRNFVIGFIHLILLGLGTFFMLAMIRYWGLIRKYSFLLNSAFMLLIAGFLGTELILFIQGIFFWFELGFLPAYYIILFSASLVLFFGVLLLFVEMIRIRRLYPYSS